MSDPSVYVGTMYSGEGDIDECIRMINAQVGVSVRHVIIRNLPEKEAHNTLWRGWRESKQDFEFFVKVDADTVINDETAFQELWELFQDEDVTGIQCPLHDFYSDSLINGMNCFSPHVIFRDTDDELYCDRVDEGHKKVLRAPNLPSILRPVGKHCWYSKDVHSFHYGLHRRLKGQTSLLQKVRSAWEKEPDRRRGLALLGAKAAVSWQSAKGFNYDDNEFKDVYKRTLEDYDNLVKTL